MLGIGKDSGNVRQNIEKGGDFMENVKFTKRELGIIYDTISLYMDMNPIQSDEDIKDYDEMNEILAKCFKVLDK